MQQVFLYFSFFLSLALAGIILPCGPNEEFTHCGTVCPKTCQNHTSDIICPEVCVIGCSCKDGFVRKSVDGHCVPIEQCTDVSQSECEENEEFKHCTSACPDTCDDVDSSLPKKCPMKCVKGCACKDGFIRSRKGGKCVAKDTCVKKDGVVCKENEIFKDCGSFCPATCSEPVRNCQKSCSRGCFCKDGYVLDNKTNECVKTEDCSNRIHQ